MNYNKIYFLIKERGLSQERLAGAIGMTRNGFNKALKSENFKIEILERIAQELGVNVGYFFDEELESAGSGHQQKATGSKINQNMSIECENKVKVLQAELDGLKRELSAKDKIIELLERQTQKK